MIRLARDVIRKFFDVDQEYRLRRALNRFLPPKRPSQCVHIVHACVWKTASQWFRVILSDPRVYRHDGRMPFTWTELTKFDSSRKSLRKQKSGGLLLSCFAPLEAVREVIGKAAYKAFFVIRDPRDLLISWYFSTRYTHSATAGVQRHREALEGMNDEEGLVYMIQPFIDEFLPIFESWLKASQESDDVIIVRFEDLTKGGIESWQSLFHSVGMNVPDETIAALLDTYHISKISGKTKASSSELSQNKYAFSGKDMTRLYLKGAVLERYNELLPTLAMDLGYGPEPASFAKLESV